MCLTYILCIIQHDRFYWNIYTKQLRNHWLLFLTQTETSIDFVTLFVCRRAVQNESWKEGRYEGMPAGQMEVGVRIRRSEGVLLDPWEQSQHGKHTLSFSSFCVLLFFLLHVSVALILSQYSHGYPQILSMALRALPPDQSTYIRFNISSSCG